MYKEPTFWEYLGGWKTVALSVVVGIFWGLVADSVADPFLRFIVGASLGVGNVLIGMHLFGKKF
jgi:hypothetical protein